MENLEAAFAAKDGPVENRQYSNLSVTCQRENTEVSRDCAPQS